MWGAEVRAIAARAAALAVLLLAAAAARAGTEQVEYPKDYRSRFAEYNRVDRPDRKPAVVRFFYVNPEALAVAKPAEPLPYGTVLVMEDHKARVDEAGRPARDGEGRLVPTDEVINVFVQAKGRGFGAEYPESKRNGEWEYAWFLPDGARKADAKFDGCFTCHLNRAGRDYNFTFSKYLLDERKP